MSDRDTGAHYLNSVDSIAEEIREEYPDSDKHHNQRVERVHESVDSSRWMIYTYLNEVVIETTDNEPDGREVAVMSGPDATWRRQRQIAAFLAMEADVHEALREKDKEAADKEAEEAETEAEATS